MKTISASDFKAKCLSLIENPPAEGIIITKRGEKVAVLYPYVTAGKESYGLLKKKLKILSDIESMGTL
jgi:antitoxin (DNA-binding transcriptional repressor) of toxin-antitoxin stability system